MGRKIGYILSRFPHLPETFILREISELNRLGWQVSLYPLIYQHQEVVHPQAEAWLEHVHEVPFLSLAVIAENLRTLVRKPGRYLSLLWQTLWGNLPCLKFLLRAAAIFPKTVYTACLMEREGIEQIHAHYGTHPALAAWLIHRLTGIPYSVTLHAHDIYVDRTMLETKLRHAALVITISQFNRHYLREKVGEWLAPKVKVVHCGVDPALYRAAPTRTGASERFEVVSVGSLQPYKGQSHLIEACALLKRKGIAFRCRIAGGGELREALEGRIASLGLSGEVGLLGARSEEQVSELLGGAHCYVQPSVITPQGKMEGLPVALMEAMASRLPVVASSISGIPELVRHGETGLLVPPEDSQALAEAMLEVYSDPELAKRLSANGHAAVLEGFDLQANVKELARHFAQIELRPARQARSEAQVAQT